MINKLNRGDEIRIIAPSLYYKVTEERCQKAKKRLENKGYKVTFCEGLISVEPDKITNSLSIAERVKDFNDAYSDKNVKCIIPITGGYNANQILPYIDFELINANPKIFCGYSDITVLNNAIYSKTGQITFSGPNFNNFGVYDDDVFEFIFESFLNAISNKKNEISISKTWLDNKDIYNKRESFIKNIGLKKIHKGNFNGVLIGGNLCSFNLLQGTEFMPDLTESVLFVEDDYIFTSTVDFLLEFERNLVSLTQQPNFKLVKGILIGRFEQRSGITIEMLSAIINKIKVLDNLPIIANLDFGHTSPIITLPIGKVIINKLNSLIIINHD